MHVGKLIQLLRRLRRMRLQYGLRSLLIAMVTVCVALGWYVERVRRQWEAVAALTKAGATIQYYERDPVSPEAAEFYAAAGQAVPEPRNFAERVEGATPERVRTALGADFFRRVESADLSKVDLELAAALGRLRDLRGLRQLELYFSETLDEDMPFIGALGSLTTLNADSTCVTDAGLAHLTGLRKLERLGLSFTGITGAGLVHLSRLRQLEHLDLSFTRVSDAGLESLADLRRLKTLDLSSTDITDRGLRVLAKLTSLQDLRIVSTAVTLEGAAWLKKRLPKTEIDVESTGDDAAYQAYALAGAGCWRQALDAIDRCDGPDFQSDDGLFVVGQCHAGLAHWDQAERAFCDLLEQRARDQWWTDNVWQELYQWPSLWERVARARPRDAWRWIVSARRAIVEGRWPDVVADYARAANCPHPLWEFAGKNWDSEDSIDFQYGVSMLLIGDVAEQRRACDRLLKAGREFKRPSEPFRNSMLAAAHLHLLAPQGTACPSEVADWLADYIGDGAAADMWGGGLCSLIYCRAGEFDKVFEDRNPPDGHPFLCAIAHHHLGHGQQARECFEQGSRWLARRTKSVRVVRVYADVIGAAPRLLEVEVLRREAEKLLFGR